MSTTSAATRAVEAAVGVPSAMGASTSALAVPAQPPTTTHHDIWLDTNTVHYLRYGQHRPGTPIAEQKRIWKRLSQSFRMVDDVMQRRMPDGVWRTVPSPQQRTAIILQCHRSTGHWGVRRTYYMVSLQHWWYNMADDVKRVLQTCVECSRIKASFSANAAAS
jgi:hypothetical protein